MTYCIKCGKPTNNGIMCEDCIILDSPWLLAMKSKEADLVEQIEKFKAENAELRATLSKMETVEKELRERLEKAVELPCKVGDIVYCVDDEDEDGDYIVKPTVVTKKNIYLLCSRIKGNPSDAFLLQKAAEEWCKELKGEEK